MTDLSEAQSVESGHDEKQVLTLDSVTKRFGRVLAVDDVSLNVQKNEIFALVGDNGAGKSTLLNVLSGVHEPTSGKLSVRGEPVAFDNPSDARAMGIETVYQDLALMGDLDIVSNLYMGRFPTKVDIGPLKIIDWSETKERTREILEYLSLDIDPKTEVQFLSGGQRQLVAVGRSLLFDPSVLILDEPTSALSVAGKGLVHETLEQLHEEGHTIVIVSHNLDDVYDLADRIGVMYRGRLVDIVNPESTTKPVLRNLVTTGKRRP